MKSGLRFNLLGEVPSRVTPAEELGNVAVEIIDQDFESTWQTMAPDDRLEVEVPPGAYLIRAYLPSGEMLSEQRSVRKGSFSNVGLSIGESTRADWRGQLLHWDAWDTPRGDSLLGGVWTRLWRRTHDYWTAEPLTAKRIERVGSTVMFTTRVGARPHLLQLGGPAVPWRFVALPPKDKVEVRVHLSRAELKASRDPLTVRVSGTRSKDAEVLLEYLTSGSGGPAAAAEIARSLVEAKRQDPTSTAVRGYYLLRTGRLNELESEWVRMLADRHDWLADGAVIYAWQALRRKPKSIQIFEEQILEAARRGLPVYTEGLKLLFQGLQILAASSKGTRKEKLEIGAELNRIRKTAKAADWTSPRTSFRGRTPGNPSHVPVDDIPEDWRSLRFVSHVRLEDLVKAGVLRAGDRLIWERPRLDQRLTASVTESGGFEVEGASEALSPTAATEQLASYSGVAAWQVWKEEKSGLTLDQIRQQVTLGESGKMGSRSAE